MTLKKPVALKIKKPLKPKCPKHKEVMVFDISLSTWACSHENCNVVAKYRSDIEQATSEMINPTLALEITQNYEGEDTYFLKSMSNGKTLLIDVTSYVDMAIDDQTNSVTLCLLFNNVSRMRE